MTTNKIAFNFPEELIQAIDFHANAMGRDRTTVVVQVLKQIFGLSSEEILLTDASTVKQQDLISEEQKNEFSELGKRVDKLEKKIDGLAEQLAELSQAVKPDSVAVQYTTAISEQLVNLVAEPTASVHQVEIAQSQATDLLSSKYVQIDNLLSSEEVEGLYKCLCQRRKPALINDSTQDTKLWRFNRNYLTNYSKAIRSQKIYWEKVEFSNN